MPYASAFERDIFISYCHTDNENPLGTGWIEVFHNILRLRLKQILGARTPEEEPSIWRDARLQGNDAFADVLIEELRKVALVVSIVSPSYVRSEWCVKEISEFCRAAEERGGVVVGNKARIFKVLKTPVTRDKHPPVLQSQIGYDFYTLDKDTRIPQEFTLTPGDTNGPKALEVINELAYHIKATLDVLNQALARAPQAPAAAAAQPIAAAAPGARKRSVYLAETSFELDEERTQVRRDLEARGIRVLPEGDLPVRNPVQFKQTVKAALAECDLSVHMIASNRSLVLPGETHDTVYLQNQMAADHCAAVSCMTRLIWIPEGTTSGDALQQQFIETLHTDPAAQKNADVLTDSTQGLITRIHDVLRKLDEPKKGAAPPQPGTVARSVIYLVAHPEDAPFADPLRDTLFERGFDVLDPLSDAAASEKEIQDCHRMNLVDCDAVVLCYGKANEFWMRSQLSEAQKAVGWREGRPLKARAVLLAPPDTAPKSRFRPPHDYLVLDARAGFEPAMLESLAAALSPAQAAG
jgi:hypothetical protein